MRSTAGRERHLSFYVHIPYCIKRCGYCDFNTYTPSDLHGGDVSAVSRGYISDVIREIEQAEREIGDAVVPTIFFGGGTPTLLPSRDLVKVVDAIAGRFNLAKRCEITVEANPDSVTRESLSQLREGGINRISFGMQSASPHVLQVLNRTHNPENLSSATTWAAEVGFEHISVDLIYGSPTETLFDWQNTISTALTLPIDHVSAYALIVEKGTRLAKEIADGVQTMPDDDETAEKYRIADDAFRVAGFDWYELSNWAKPGGECRHNIAYWNNNEWWGVGPGAHSHIGNSRWWNVKHPTTYRSRIENRESVIAEREELTEENKQVEKFMLAIRMRDGISRREFTPAQESVAEDYRDTGHIEEGAWESGSLVLTQSGRLIADRIVRELLV